jgi:hypothetical protein
MSLREEAFELFAKGNKPGDPELRTLGLAASTVKKYYYLYRGQPKPTAPSEDEAEVPPKIQPEAEREAATAPALVPLDSLKITEKFTLNGDLYRVAEVTPEFIRVTKLKEISYDVNATMLSVIGRATLATYTMVKPVK